MTTTAIASSDDVELAQLPAFTEWRNRVSPPVSTTIERDPRTMKMGNRTEIDLNQAPGGWRPWAKRWLTYRAYYKRLDRHNRDHVYSREDVDGPKQLDAEHDEQILETTFRQLDLDAFQRDLVRTWYYSVDKRSFNSSPIAAFFLSVQALRHKDHHVSRSYYPTAKANDAAFQRVGESLASAFRLTPRQMTKYYHRAERLEIVRDAIG